MRPARKAPLMVCAQQKKKIELQPIIGSPRIYSENTQMMDDPFQANTNNTRTTRNLH